MAVSQTMTSPDILEKLAAFVPGPVMQAIYRNPQPLTQPIHRRFPAAVLFSDISGFTPLSELLHQAGPTGAEDLTYFINQYFTQMIELIDRHHGQVVKFSGDALTALFPAEDYSMEIAVRLAGECALAMQSKMAGFARIDTPQGAVSLSMKAGVGAGQVLEASIGGVLGRWEYVVCGAPLAQVALAERQAQPGQTIFSPQAWEMARSYFSGVALADSFRNVSQVRTPLTIAPPLAVDWGKLGWEQRNLAEKALQRYIPGAIKARLNEQSEWLAELRRMTTLFIGIGGFDFEADDAPEKLQNFLQATQELTYRFEGSLGKVAVDDKGTVLIILFGAPPFFHEDDARRGVACALALQTVAREQGLRMSIGITEGLIFAGPVGAPNRREYTVIGDQVNLAARLMQYGRAGTILITERVRDRAGPHFIAESLGRITLKGKAQTEPAFEVKGEQDAQEEFITRYLSYEDPLIGREAEMEKIRELAAHTHHGDLQILFIQGELGSGKSRLTAELVREWLMQGNVGYGSRCISYGRQFPYQAWREVLAAIFGLNPSLQNRRQLARLAARVAELADPPGQPNYWADRLPLIADVMGLDAPDNEFTRRISGELRRDNTFVLIEALLRQQAERKALLILLEDIHWADELSLMLTHYLAQKLVDCPLLLVLVHRPVPNGDFAPITQLQNLPYAHSINLAPLSISDSEALIRHFLKNRAISTDAIELLLSRGQGNPFLLQEITGAILDMMEEDEQGKNFKLPKTFELPDTVQDVILSRLDTLSEDEKLTLKIASVIGVNFQRNLLVEIHPMHDAQYLLPAQLDKLATENLLRLEAPAPKWEYVFHNVITQEVTYEGLLLAQRRQLHQAVGDVLEKTVPVQVERLAFHYSHSNDLEKALRYLQAAAQKAQHEFANRAAIDYYSQILTCISERASSDNSISITSPFYWDTLLERARLYNLLGQSDEEVDDLGALGVIAEALDDDFRRALAANQWSYLYETVGDYPSGTEVIGRSVELAEKIGDTKLAGEGYNRWGKLLYLQGDYDTAFEYLQKALRIAQRNQDKSTQAASLSSLGMVAHYQTDYEVALYFFEEAKALWEEMGDQAGIGITLRNMGEVYYDMGKFASALDSYDQSLSYHQKVGDRAGEALTRLQLGRVQRSLGNFDTARILLEQALITYQSIGDPRHEAHALGHLGFLYFRMGRQEAALTFLEEAYLIFQDLSDPWEKGNLLTYYGWTLFEQESYEEAERYFTAAASLEGVLHQEGPRLEDVAHLGHVALARKNFIQADDYAQQVLRYIKKHGTRGMEHPAKVYLICYDIFRANKNDSQAQQVLALGQEYLANKISQIEDHTLRSNFLKLIPENRRFQELLRDEGESAK